MTAVGAFGIACYYMPFVFMVGNAIAQSAQPIISYNFGAGLHGRVAATERIALLTAVVCGAAVTLLFVYCPEWLVGLFVDPTVAAARIAIDGFPLVSAAFVCFILNLTAIGYYQSVERIRPATAFALLRGMIFLVPSFILLPAHWVLPASGWHWRYPKWQLRCVSPCFTCGDKERRYDTEMKP